MARGCRHVLHALLPRRAPGVKRLGQLSMRVPRQDALYCRPLQDAAVMTPRGDNLPLGRVPFVTQEHGQHQGLSA